jgi:hypothetical protein
VVNFKGTTTYKCNQINNLAQQSANCLKRFAPVDIGLFLASSRSFCLVATSKPLQMEEDWVKDLFRESLLQADHLHVPAWWKCHEEI